METCTSLTCCLGRSVVPSITPANATIAFICGPPDYRALDSLQPLAGDTGKLFEHILNRCGLHRPDVAVISTIRCADFQREDRRPLPNELDACQPRLIEEIAGSPATLIFTLGNIAQAMFFPGMKVGQIHGKLRVWNGRLVCPLYDIGAALPFRSPQLQQVIIEDIVGALALLD